MTWSNKVVINVHNIMDAFGGLAEIVRLTEARVHDCKFLYHIDLSANSFMVFDKAYNLYSQYNKWEKKIWFVTCMKDNAVYHATKVLLDNTKRKSQEV